VTNASVNFARVSKGADTYTGVQASVTSAALVGVDAVDLEVSGTVKLNLTSRGTARRSTGTARARTLSGCCRR